MALLCCRKDIKSLTARVGHILDGHGRETRPEHLDAAYQIVTHEIGSRYYAGKLTWVDAREFLSALSRYGFENPPVEYAYELYQAHLSTAGAVRRALDDFFRISVLEISLSRLEKIENGTVFVRNDRKEAQPLLNPEACREHFAEHARQHPGEYAKHPPNPNCVGEHLWLGAGSFFLFYTPRKVYITLRDNPLKFRFRPAAENACLQNQFAAFPKQLEALGFCTYDLS